MGGGGKGEEGGEGGEGKKGEKGRGGKEGEGEGGGGESKVSMYFILPKPKGMHLCVIGLVIRMQGPENPPQTHNGDCAAVEYLLSNICNM